MPDLAPTQAVLFTAGLALVLTGVLGLLVLFVRFPAPRETLRIQEWEASPGAEAAPASADVGSQNGQWIAAYTGAVEEMFADILSLRQEMAQLAANVDRLRSDVENDAGDPAPAETAAEESPLSQRAA